MATQNQLSQTAFQEILQTYKQELENRSYRPSTVHDLVRVISRVYESTEKEMIGYSFSKSENWLKDQYKRMIDGKIKKMRYVQMHTAIEQFNQFLREGTLTIKKRYLSSKVLLPEYFLEIQRAFLKTLPEDLHRSTVRIYEVCSRQFFDYLFNHSIVDLKMIKFDIIENYLAETKESHKDSMEQVLHTLKKLLIFLKEKRLLNTSLNINLDFLKPGYKRKAVLPHFTYDEVNTLLGLIDRSTSMGKRDYAVVCIAVYTGMRISDIIDMHLKDIKWRQQEILIIQQKTGNSLKLPMNIETGNALADYILNGRPESNDDHVFIKSLAPYDRILDGGAVGKRILKKYYAMDEAFAEKCAGKTFHCFRRGMGSWLSIEQTPLPIISEILGHTNLEATKFYLSYNHKDMAKCCLGLDHIQILKEGLI